MIQITEATKGDLRQISQLFSEYDTEIERYFPKNHLQLQKNLSTEHGDTPKRRSEILKCISDKNQHFLVAKENEIIIGCVLGWVESHNNAGKFDQLILSDKSKNEEVLKLLYIELEKWFKDQKCPYILVDVITKNPRKELYGNIGFETVLEEMRKII